MKIVRFARAIVQTRENPPGAISEAALMSGVEKIRYPVELTVELGESPYTPGQRWASVKAGDVALFTELVYDTAGAPALNNILLLFGERLRRLLEDS